MFHLLSYFYFKPETKKIEQFNVEHPDPLIYIIGQSQSPSQNRINYLLALTEVLVTTLQLP